MHIMTSNGWRELTFRNVTPAPHDPSWHEDQQRIKNDLIVKMLLKSAVEPAEPETSEEQYGWED